MTFSGLNLIGVLVAFFVSFISGAIWFGPKTFYPVWMKAKGHPDGGMSRNLNNPLALFGGTIVAVLIQTFTVALVVTSLQHGHPNFGVKDGALVGLVIGVGIAMCSSLSHRLFGGESFKVWVIETANDAINLMISGAIIAYFN